MTGHLKNFWSFISGGAIGTLGGLIGLGGAEFRLPLLVGIFGFASLDAVIINKITSLIVVSFSLPFRSQSIPWSDVVASYGVILNILSGSLIGAWTGAHYATKMKTQMLDRLIMILLIALAFAMIFGHGMMEGNHSALIQNGNLRIAAGIISGLAIGIVAAVLGVAGGELIIPTLVVLFGVDIKLAGSLSLCISLPTMIVAFYRYTQSGAIDLFKREKKFLIIMALGSILGAAIGGRLIGIIPSNVLVLVLGGILLISAIKTFKKSHSKKNNMKKIIFSLLMAVSIGLQAQTVKVAAAADLRYAMDEIAQLYMKTKPGTNVEVVFGSSGNAYTQISNGAPFDVYFSADIMYPQKLKEAGLAISEIKLYAIGRIVLWSSTLDVSKGMDVLKTPKIKIATANPEHAPYGQRAVEALKYYKLYDMVEKQLSFGENISQAAQFCLTGNAEAGLLALSLVLSPSMADKGKYYLIPAEVHRPLEQAYVVLKRAENNKTAYDFCDFVATRPAREIFEKYGFTLP